MREAQEESIKNENNKQNLNMNLQANSTTSNNVNNASSSNSGVFAEEEAISFNSCFDNYKGQVHLEALEMLSRQSIVKYEMEMLNLNEKRVNSILEPLKPLFNLDEINNDDNVDTNKEFNLIEFEDIFIDYMSELKIKLPIDKIIQSFKTSSYTSSELSTNTIFVSI